MIFSIFIHIFAFYLLLYRSIPFRQFVQSLSSSLTLPVLSSLVTVSQRKYQNAIDKAHTFLLLPNKILTIYDYLSHTFHSLRYLVKMLKTSKACFTISLKYAMETFLTRMYSIIMYMV